MLRVTLRWTSIPSRGEQKYSQILHATETGISSSLMSHLACMQTFHFTSTSPKIRLHCSLSFLWSLVSIDELKLTLTAFAILKIVHIANRQFSLSRMYKLQCNLFTHRPGRAAMSCNEPQYEDLISLQIVGFCRGRKAGEVGEKQNPRSQGKDQQIVQATYRRRQLRLLLFHLPILVLSLLWFMFMVLHKFYARVRRTKYRQKKKMALHFNEFEY